MRGRRLAKWVGLGAAVVGVVVLVVLLVFTQTDWGRERTRAFALDQLATMINGQVEIGRIEGNLLKRIRLIDVSIRDERGRLFLQADTLEARFGLRALLRQRIELGELRIVDAHLVLDQPPGEEWNYVRIFDTGAQDTGGGASPWGDWVTLEEVVLVDTRVTVRAEWQPAEGLSPEERRTATRLALAGEAREHVVEVPGGYQNVMEFRELDARLTEVVVAHPDSAGMHFNLAGLSGLVRPFSPPAARVRDLAGDFSIVRDSLFMSEVRAELSHSRLAGGGVYAIPSGELLLVAHADPVAFGDLRWLYPQLPEEGVGSMEMTLEVGTPGTRIVLRDMDVALGDARLTGLLDVTTGDGLRFGPTDLDFTALGTDVVERFTDIEMPRQGELSGTVALRGPPRSLALNADVRFDDAAGPNSRVLAEGSLGTEPALRFQELRLRFRPLDATLARAVAPDLPLRGTIEGSAVVTGTPTNLEVDADLALRDPRHGLSRVRLAGGLDTREDVQLRQMVVRMDPLRLDLIRDEIPALPQGAAATGRLVLDGAVSGTLNVDGNLVVDDPATGVSEVGATGRIALSDGPRFHGLRLRFDPLQAELARSLIPELGVRGTIAGTAMLTGTPESLEVDADLSLRDPRYGLSRVAAVGGLDTGSELRLRGMRVRMDPLQADVLREWLPDLPPGGSLTGALNIDGAPARFVTVSGEVAHHHPELGVSRVEIDGGIGLASPVRFEDLDLRLEPLQMALARALVPDLPLGGALRGTARLNGSPESRLLVRGDLVHVENGERSHVAGTADVALGPGGSTAVDVRLEPLSLAVAGQFVPGAGLHGTVAGRLRASGDVGDISLDADLTTADGGRIVAEGTLDLSGAEPIYDLDTRLSDFDLAALSWRAPARTDLTGTVVARGRGLDPATMNAVIDADLVSSEVSDLGADLLRLRVALNDGLARMDSSVIRLDGAEAVLDGSFGLVAGRHGELAYRVEVDSLHAFASWLPGAERGVSTVGSTAMGRPQPEATAEPAVELAPPDAAEPDAAAPAAAPTAPELAASPDEPVRRYVAADGARVTEIVTLVEANIDRGHDDPERGRMKAMQQELLAAEVAGERTDTTGLPATRATSPAGRPTTPADSLAGSLHASGTVRGNVERFDLEGRAIVEDLLYRAAWIGAGEAEFALADWGTQTPEIELDADLRDVRAAGTAFDTLSARARYHGLRGDGTGEAVVGAQGTGDTGYLADVVFELSPERKEVRIADLTLRYDTVTWQMTQPGTVSWANDEIHVASIDFRSDVGGSVRLDGRLPVDGSGDLNVVVEELEIAQFTALLQLDRDAAGLLNVDANVRGTLEAPRMSGTLRLDDARLNGGAVPDLRASFGYAAGELTLDGSMLREGRRLAMVEGTLPIDLSLTPDPAPRLLPGPIALDIQADSLPLEAIPILSNQVTDARGRVRGQLAVRGTFSDPQFTGDIDLALGSVRIAPLGLHLQDVAGRLVLQGDRVVVDSLVARSEGAVRIAGEIGLESLTSPTFALDIGSRETLVIDTKDAKLRLDADLTVGGTLDALVVEGDIRTRSGVIYIPKLTELGNAHLVSLDSPEGARRFADEFFQRLRLPARQAPLLDRLRLDVAVQVDRDVWLRSTEANVEIYTPPEAGPLRIVLDGGETGLALEGTINTDRGEYEFMSRRFDLTRGAATFSGDPAINPVLQLAAEHEIRLPGRGAFDMRVLLSGTLRDLEITLESNSQPPISQTDLLAYLAFGRNATSLLYQQGSPLSAQAGHAGELAGNVAGVATQQLGTIALDAVLSDVESDLMRDLNVDVFRITPADLPPDMFTGKYVDLLRSTEVEAGRYVSPGLFVAGQVNTGMSRPGLRVEYAAPFGLQWETTWRSRWLPRIPTLTDQTPRRAGILGSFLFREWRF